MRFLQEITAQKSALIRSGFTASLRAALILGCFFVGMLAFDFVASEALSPGDIFSIFLRLLPFVFVAGIGAYASIAMIGCVIGMLAGERSRTLETTRADIIRRGAYSAGLLCSLAEVLGRLAVTGIIVLTIGFLEQFVGGDSLMLQIFQFLAEGTIVSLESRGIVPGVDVVTVVGVLLKRLLVIGVKAVLVSAVLAALAAWLIDWEARERPHSFDVKTVKLIGQMAGFLLLNFLLEFVIVDVLIYGGCIALALLLFKHQKSPTQRIAGGLLFGMLISLFYRGLFLDVGFIVALLIAFVVGSVAAGKMFQAVKAS